MEGIVLTVAGGTPGGPVLPRRIRLELRPGAGRLRLGAVPPTDPFWRRSVSAAWDVALRLTDRRDVDATLHVAGPNPVSGISSGLPVGLLALAVLMDAEADPHLATGGVLAGAHRSDHAGWLEGGRLTARKAAAAASLAPQLGLDGAVFVSPPVEAEAARGAPMPVRLATDLGAAYDRVAPAGYAALARRHDDLRRAGVDGLGDAGLDPQRPFALVQRPHPRHGGGWPEEVEGVQVAVAAAPSDAEPEPEPESEPGAALVRLGERGRLLWTVRVPDDPAVARAFPRLLALARLGA